MMKIYTKMANIYCFSAKNMILFKIGDEILGGEQH